MVDGSTTTVLLEGLNPLTEYVVNVYSVVNEGSSEPLKGTETTCKCAPPSLPFCTLPGGLFAVVTLGKRSFHTPCEINN